jgi:hypothetical protein
LLAARTLGAYEVRDHTQREREIEHDRMLKAARIKDKL